MLRNDRIDGHEQRSVVLKKRRSDTVAAEPRPGPIVLSASLPVIAFAEHRQRFGPPGLRDIDIKYDPAGAAPVGSGKVISIDLAGVLRFICEHGITIII